MGTNLYDVVVGLYLDYMYQGIPPGKSCFLIQDRIYHKISTDEILKIISKYISERESYRKEFPKRRNTEIDWR